MTSSILMPVSSASAASLGDTIQGAQADQSAPSAKQPIVVAWEGSPEDIVVTARKREESLRNVPEAISALSSAALTTRGVVTLNDLGRQTPGLTMFERQNHIPNVVLRGIGSFGFVEGVGFYIDDVQNFTDKTMRLEDLDRVEILKGPQATLFGGSSLAGAVRYISRRPSFDTSAEFKGELGERAYHNVYGAVNAPLVGDMVAARLSGYYTHDNGFTGDSNLHTPTSELREYGVRGQILLKPTDNFSALITVRYRDYDGANNSYIRENSVKSVSTITALTFVPNFHSKTYGAVAELNYDFGGATLTSISSYTHQKIHLILDGDYSPAPTLTATVNGTPGKVYTQELRLTSTSGGAFDWIAGLYAARRQNVFNTPVPLVITAGPRVFNPFLDYDARQTEFAAFGNGNIHFGDFTASAGARVLKTIYKADTRFASAVPDPGHYRVADTVVLPKGTLSYKAGGGPLFYASVAEGYESGKVDVSAAPAAPYKPETDWTYEIGAKGDLGSSIYYELSAYYIDSNNRQTETIFSTPQGVMQKRTQNIGDARTYGAEGNIRWRPVTGLSLEGAVGYLDAKWTNAAYGGVSLRGRRIPNAAPWTASVAGTYSVPLTSALKLALHADAAYKDSFPWQVTYTPISNENPSYWLANARIGIGSTSGAWELAARIDNLFDKKYYTEFFPVQYGPQAADGTCIQCHTGAIGGLRRLIVSLDVKF